MCFASGFLPAELPVSFRFASGVLVKQKAPLITFQRLQKDLMKGGFRQPSYIDIYSIYINIYIYKWHVCPGSCKEWLVGSGWWLVVVGGG